MTDGPGEDIYVTTTSDYVAVRWDAHTYYGDDPADVEAVLYRDGRIRFNYGAAHTGLTPTIGVSAGDGVHYLLSSRNGAPSIPANVSSLLTYEAPLPPGLSLNPATGALSGTPTQLGNFTFTVQVHDAGSPQQSVSQQFALEVSNLPVCSVTLPAAAREGAGRLTGLGTVSVPQPVPADLTVTLASSDPTEASLPAATVTIPAGKQFAAFDLDIQDDAVLDGSQRVVVTASAAGCRDGAASILVDDNETAVLTVNVPLGATEGDGLLTAAGSVTVSAPPVKDVVVDLFSANAGEVALPVASAVIRAGRTVSDPFDLEVQDDARIDGLQQVAITARVPYWTDGAASIAIADNDAYLRVQLPAKLWEGQGRWPWRRVVLGGSLSADIVVSLASSDESELIVPATVTVLAGQMTASFDLDVQDDAEQDGSQALSVSASAPGLADGTTTTRVGDNELHHFAFEPIGDPQTAAVSLPVTVMAKDVNGATIEVYDGPVSLTAAAAGVPVAIEFTAKAAGPAAAPAERPVEPKNVETAAASKSLGVYHSYSELTTELGAYAAAHPDIARLVSIGRSIQGRDLWAMKITDNPDAEEDEPEVKYVARSTATSRWAPRCACTSSTTCWPTTARTRKSPA